MTFFGRYFGGSDGDGIVSYVPANISNAATQETIRDRVIALIETLTPESLTSDKFRGYRNEDGVDFEEWAESHANAALRRFQVREIGEDEPPVVSNTQFETVELELRITIAYPQTHRYGAANGMDRDDAIAEDWKRINFAIGIYGRGNFSGTNDCTPLGAVKVREQGAKVDYLVVTARYQYQRSTT